MKKLFVAFAAILLFISCHNSSNSKNELSQLTRDLKDQKKPIPVDDEKNKHLGDIGVNAAPTDKQEPGKTKQVQQIPPPKIDWDKKIIKNASLHLEVKDHASSYSTITLTFYQVINEKAIDNDKPSFAARVGNAFRSGWEWIGDLSVAIVSIWPLLLFFFAVFVFYKRSKRPTVKQV